MLTLNLKILENKPRYNKPESKSATTANKNLETSMIFTSITIDLAESVGSPC